MAEENKMVIMHTDEWNAARGTKIWASASGGLGSIIFSINSFMQRCTKGFMGYRYNRQWVESSLLRLLAFISVRTLPWSHRHDGHYLPAVCSLDNNPNKQQQLRTGNPACWSFAPSTSYWTGLWSCCDSPIIFQYIISNGVGAILLRENFRRHVCKEVHNSSIRNNNKIKFPSVRK